jgi:hypothetical protein
MMMSGREEKKKVLEGGGAEVVYIRAMVRQHKAVMVFGRGGTVIFLAGRTLLYLLLVCGFLAGKYVEARE